MSQCVHVVRMTFWSVSENLLTELHIYQLLIYVSNFLSSWKWRKLTVHTGPETLDIACKTSTFPFERRHTCFRMLSSFFSISECSLASMVLRGRSPSLDHIALQATYPATMTEKKTKMNRRGHMIQKIYIYILVCWEIWNRDQAILVVVGGPINLRDREQFGQKFEALRGNLKKKISEKIKRSEGHFEQSKEGWRSRRSFCRETTEKVKETLLSMWL